jgi:hypothetical protein
MQTEQRELQVTVVMCRNRHSGVVPEVLAHAVVTI